MLREILKYKFLIISIIILLVAIPIIFSLIKPKKPEYKISPDGISVILNPQTSTINVGDELNIAVNINGKIYNISAIDITFEYDRRILSKASLSTSQTFTTIVNDSNLPGKIHYVGVNVTQSSIIGESINIGILSFKPKAAGNAKIEFSNIHINASGEADALPVDLKNTKIGNYKIK